MGGDEGTKCTIYNHLVEQRLGEVLPVVCRRGHRVLLRVDLGLQSRERRPEEGLVGEAASGDGDHGGLCAGGVAVRVEGRAPEDEGRAGEALEGGRVHLGQEGGVHLRVGVGGAGSHLVGPAAVRGGDLGSDSCCISES